MFGSRAPSFDWIKMFYPIFVRYFCDGIIDTLHGSDDCSFVAVIVFVVHHKVLKPTLTFSTNNVFCKH